MQDSIQLNLQVPMEDLVSGVFFETSERNWRQACGDIACGAETVLIKGRLHGKAQGWAEITLAGPPQETNEGQAWPASLEAEVLPRFEEGCWVHTKGTSTK